MILIFVDNIDRASFFKRLILGGKCRTFKVITLKFSVYMKLRRYVDVELVKLDKYSSHNDIVDYPDDSILLLLTHVYRGSQSLNRAKKIYHCVTNHLTTMKNCSEITYGIVHNGNSAGALAFTNFIKFGGGEVLFTEISNLPGKVIFDPKGVNARSSIYEDASILDSFDSMPESKHIEWIGKYEDYKCNPIPQSKNKLSFLVGYVVDRIYGAMVSGVVEEDISWRGKFKYFQASLKSKSVLTKGEMVDLDDKPYLFFPTQVKNDSQLIINSDYDNISALKYAINIANDRSLEMYVKIHPAETDLELMSAYHELMELHGFHIVSNNTTELIKKSNVVITINSTVGLEALIFDKELLTLGRAIYKDFDYERVKKYIHRYLINFDYFSSDIIETHEFEKLESLIRKAV